ncbi:BspA family leucine-rich repeat surface protein (plasmid) [Lactococcus lactis subsp. lactis]|nr:BspA family leucine-rich repeat surface protein [Lactococcus lactis]WKB49929.1 BspA family leucine-rich repeat surface protein [Lactococcus lactis subsp. lactis]
MAAADSSKLFANLDKLTTFENMSNFDTSNVTIMSGIFSRLIALTSLDVSHFDTSKVTDVTDMFKLDSLLSTITLVEKWMEVW